MAVRRDATRNDVKKAQRVHGCNTGMRTRMHISHIPRQKLPPTPPRAVSVRAELDSYVRRAPVPHTDLVQGTLAAHHETKDCKHPACPKRQYRAAVCAGT